MKRKTLAAVLLILLLTLCAAGALAADVFRFETKSIDIFEGDTVTPALLREGNPAEEGTLTFTAGNPKAVSVNADGTISGLQKGISTVKATLKTAKRSWTANLTVNVLRRVTVVTLDTTRLQIYQPTDVEISGLLREETLHDVIVLPAGRHIDLKATCTPSDASSKKVIFTSSDEGILKMGNASATAKQAGECDLTISSAQNPEVTQVYRVLVIQPISKITVSSEEGKTVDAGDTLQLTASFEPSNASIQKVEWKSKNEQVATVDENGVVTGVKKGNVAIEAKAADGSGKTAAIQLTVAQPVTSITIKEESLNMATGQNGYVHATAHPESANDKNIVWSSTDSSIATVTNAGQVKGIQRGECTLIATSRSNPNVYQTVRVRVIQRVTGINFTCGQVSLPIRTTAQLTWEVLPEDADIREVSFTSSNKKVATVDPDGLIHGMTRGTSVITATATDGSNRRAQIRITVTQPVEGVSIQYSLYHVQLEGSLNVKAVIKPSNANNQNVHFTIADDYIATVTDQKNIGRVRGWHKGSTTITGVTEDGGFSASAEIRVDDFNRAIVPDDLYLEGEDIRIVLRNRSDFTVDRVYFMIETYDAYGEPLVCNTDGVSNSFQGSYRLELWPGYSTEHYRFDFGDYMQPQMPIGTVVIKVTGWRDLEGYTRNIPESSYPAQTYQRYIYDQQTPVYPVPTNNGNGSGEANG